MVLTQEQIKEKIEHRSEEVQKEMRKASLHDDRLKFHTESEEDVDCMPYYSMFISFAENLISSKKFEVYKYLLRTPMATVKIMNGIMDELKKVFQTQDRYISFDFNDVELKDDFDRYREKIGDFKFWPGEGFETMKSAVNDFLIIDLPAVQETERPEPYYYLIEPCDVVDALPNKTGGLEYIIFKRGGYYFAFDDMFFRRIDKPSDTEYIFFEVPHNLGYTPAQNFWSRKYNKRSKLIRQNQLTGSLGEIDYLLHSITSRKHLGQYAGFPIMISYEQKCTFQDDLGNSCQMGMITRSLGDGKYHTEPCQACAHEREILGPGTWLTVPAPAEAGDPDGIGGLRMVGADVQSLEWIAGDVDDQIAWLTYNTIGVPDDVTSMAINEKQVVTQFESRINVLHDATDNFDIIMKFAGDTLARLRYGDAFKGSTVSNGKKYFLHTAEEMQKNYNEAKTGGAPTYELATRKWHMIETRYKNNPEMLERMKILISLEPFPDSSISEVNSNSEKIGATLEEMRLKANFDSYIRQFERDFVNVVSYLEAVPMKQKIQLIREQLMAYVADDLAAQLAPES